MYHFSHIFFALFFIIIDCNVLVIRLWYTTTTYLTSQLSMSIVYKLLPSILKVSVFLFVVLLFAIMPSCIWLWYWYYFSYLLYLPYRVLQCVDCTPTPRRSLTSVHLATDFYFSHHRLLNHLQIINNWISGQYYYNIHHDCLVKKVRQMFGGDNEAEIYCAWDWYQSPVAFLYILLECSYEYIILGNYCRPLLRC